MNLLGSWLCGAVLLKQQARLLEPVVLTAPVLVSMRPMRRDLRHGRRRSDVTASARAATGRPASPASAARLRPRILQRHRPVEHRRARLRVDAIGYEVAVALEL